MDLFEWKQNRNISNRHLVKKLKEREIKISPPKLGRYKKGETPIPVPVADAWQELTDGAVRFEDWAELNAVISGGDNNG